jgi:hypothetical protein
MRWTCCAFGITLIRYLAVTIISNSTKATKLLENNDRTCLTAGIQDLMPCREVCESYTNNAVKAGCNIAKLLYVDCDQFPKQELGNCTMASGPRTLNDAMKLGMNGALLLVTLMVLAITIIL